MKKKHLMKYLEANERLAHALQLASSAMTQLTKELERARAEEPINVIQPIQWLDAELTPPHDDLLIDIRFRDGQEMCHIYKSSIAWEKVVSWRASS